MSKLLTKFKRNAIDELINSVDNKKVSGATITTPGGGYSSSSVTNEKTIVSTLGGTTFRVTANATGNATSVSLVNAGVYNSNVAANNIATINTIGTGAGLTLNVSFTDEHSYYVFVGGQSEYPNSDTPLEIDNVETLRNTWNEMMFGKKANFSRMTKKYVWATGTVYTQYDDAEDLLGENFFVMNSKRDVFKCIYNNNGAESTIEPTKTASKIGVPVQEEDGYEWMYLYTISKSDYDKFVTFGYMPVTENQTVTDVAINGSIFNIKVELTGQNYPHHDGIIASVTNSAIFTIESSAITTSNYYKESSVAVIDTEGTTHVRQILSSNTSYGITVSEPFPAGFLNTSCKYFIGPTVEISSYTGSGAVAYSLLESGALDKIQIVEYGTGYKDATVRVFSGPNLGDGALARVILSPIGGHGSNVYDELHVDSLGVHCLFDEWGIGSSFNTDVTYRTVGLLKSDYQGTEFNQIRTINITENIVGTFSNGEIVYGSISNSSGRFAYANSSVLLLTGTNGSFQADEQLVGSTSGATRIVNEDLNGVDLVMYEGEILYVQNIQEVTRSASNKEQVKLVISF